MTERTMTHGEFMAAHQGLRARSPEVDYGTWWTEAGEDWPRHRVSWLEATGEVYAIAFTDDEPVEVLAIVHTREALEFALEGWGGSGLVLGWAREALVDYPADGPAGRNRRALAAQLWAERHASVAAGITTWSGRR